MADTAAWSRGHTNGSYKSESSEQLDKLLAGLDQLSETLPSLASPAISCPPQQTHQPGAGAGAGAAQRKPQLAATWNGSKSAGGAGPRRGGGGSVAGAGAEAGTRVMSLSYEDHLDYALEPRGGGAQLARGLLGTDNYSAQHSGESEGAGAGAEAGQPYHTRCDSKPFSYIR